MLLLLVFSLLKDLLPQLCLYSRAICQNISSKTRIPFKFFKKGYESSNLTDQEWKFLPKMQ